MPAWFDKTFADLRRDWKWSTKSRAKSWRTKQAALWALPAENAAQSAPLTATGAGSANGDARMWNERLSCYKTTG